MYLLVVTDGDISAAMRALLSKAPPSARRVVENGSGAGWRDVS
jgi:hypothetical protein